MFHIPHGVKTHVKKLLSPNKQQLCGLKNNWTSREGVGQNIPEPWVTSHIAGNHYAIQERAYIEHRLLPLVRRHSRMGRMRTAMGAESLSDH
jgi:hypothetical protein